MVIPSQAQIECKGCGQFSEPHKQHRLFCAACAKKKQVEYQKAYRERQLAKPRKVICKGCGCEFDASVNGRTWRCPSCITAYQADDRRRNKERHNLYGREYRKRQGDVYRAKMVKRRNDVIAALSAEELAAFRRAECDKSRRLADKLRKDVFTAYGGMKCACCGETEPKFLTIDHVANDGAEMRRNGTHSRGGTAFYQWLRKNGFPQGFQVLCMNCNLGKHRNGGVCPHQSVKV